LLSNFLDRAGIAVKEQAMKAMAARWQDWASFALGFWLALSPWIVGYTEHESATVNAVFLGLALALGCHWEAVFDEAACEWANLAAGLWLAVAPFSLGFATAYVAAANSIAVGTLVALLAASALELDKEVGKLLHKRVARQ
jgi:hypothetical protein